MTFKLVHNFNDRVYPQDAKIEIKVRCYHDRKYQYIDTGVFVEARFWDGYQITSKHPQAQAANLVIKNRLNELENAVYDYERTANRVFDFNALKNHLSGGKDSIYFCKFIADCLKNEKNLDYKTIVKYNSNIETIRELLPDKLLQNITSEDINGLDAKLREKYANSTVARLNIFTQKYLKKAAENGLININPYILTKLDKNRGEGKKIYLTPAEIKALQDLTALTPVELAVRDRFLFSCYTGLRISDSLVITKHQLTDTPDGLILNLHTIKGYGHDLIHPLRLMFDGKPERIARYWLTAHDGETLFPKMSDQYISDNLKIIVRLAGIKKPVTFHTARHTCATMLAEITQNPFLMMNLMGWSDIRVAMNYIHASHEATKRQLNVFAGKWNL